MAVNVSDELRYTGVGTGAPSLLNVPTIADRDRIGTNGVMRLNDVAYVAADGHYYQVIDIVTPVFVDLGTSLILSPADLQLYLARQMHP